MFREISKGKDHFCHEGASIPHLIVKTKHLAHLNSRYELPLYCIF